MVGYPFGLDYGWLGLDADGHVAVFTSAGLGPIPLSVITARPGADEAEDLVMRTPVNCESRGAKYECFAEFARRGLYSFDWEDLHRSIGWRSNHYELAARPTAPILATELPNQVAALALLARFSSLRFAKTAEIALRDHLDCWPAD